MKKAPHIDGADKEYDNALEEPYSTQPHRNCENCGISTHWKFCPTCYRWRIHFNAIQQAMRAMRGNQ